MAFPSILSEVGKVLKKVFTVGVKAAQTAEPFVDIVYPGIAPLFNAVVAEAVKSESLSIAAGEQENSGPMKLAAVVASVTNEFDAFTKANNLPAMTMPQIQAAVSALVAFLNAIPAEPSAGLPTEPVPELAASKP